MVFQSPVLRAQLPSYKSPYGPNLMSLAEPVLQAMRLLSPRTDEAPRLSVFLYDGIHYLDLEVELTGEMNSGVKLGGFGGVALFAVIFFASGIPKVQRDILQKIPVIGDHYIKEIPASDNPF
ncbi:hypothetical protein CHU98_g12408 [Xylaria longipes]|nr:hypothetical protein CHU98_g12408 [Xylaria longipes]